MSQAVERRAQHKAASMNSILDAAARVFASKGVDAASIDDVAIAVGSTKGRIYHYWSGKQALLSAVQYRGLNRMLATIEPIAGDTSLSPLERLERMSRAHIAMIVGDLDYQRVLLQGVDLYDPANGSRGNEAEREQLYQLRRRYEQIFTHLVDEGQRNGEVAGSDPLLTGRALLGTLNWVCVWHRQAANPDERVNRDSRTIHELSEFAIRALRR